MRVASISTAVARDAGSSLLSYHLRRIRRVAGVIAKLGHLRDRATTLYIVPDAGFGSWYTLFYVLAAIGSFRRVIFHHRSFLYITRPSVAMRIVVSITRNRALHVLLSDTMARSFRSRYGHLETMVAGNACFVHDKVIANDGRRNPDESIVLGHLSNLRRNKGVFAATDVFERLAQAGMPVRLHLAGPMTERGVGERVEALKDQYGDRVSWIGPVSGQAKDVFYRQLDLFLFATTHPQEAQPNVVYEALAAGVPVLATPRACLPEMLVGNNGACSPTEAGFVDFAVDAIRATTFHGPTAARRRDAIATQLRNESLRSRQQYIELIREIGVKAESMDALWP